MAGGSDKSLRRWERTDEPFFVEEEREKRLESLFEAEQEVGPLFWPHPLSSSNYPGWKLLASDKMSMICLFVHHQRTHFSACDNGMRCLQGSEGGAIGSFCPRWLAT